MPVWLVPPTAEPLSLTRVRLDKVGALQHTLYRPAKVDHALWDKVLRRDVLWRAWVAVRRNNGAPGVDRVSLDWIEREYGLDQLLSECPYQSRGSERSHYGCCTTVGKV